MLYSLCPDPAVIAYRQEMLDDLMAAPALAEALVALGNTFAALPHEKPPVIVALDDYQAIASPAVHHALAFLIDLPVHDMPLVVADASGERRVWAPAPTERSKAEWLGGDRGVAAGRRRHPRPWRSVRPARPVRRPRPGP